MSTMLRMRLHYHHLRFTHTSPTTSTKIPLIISFDSISKPVTNSSKSHHVPNSRISRPQPSNLQLASFKSLKKSLKNAVTSKENSRIVVIGAVSLSLALFLMGFDDHHNKALALGPEGPLLEEFWDNMRRYALYVLTVSTGALYTLLQPIVELLKNPISAVLILVIIGGGFFLVSQIVTAMVGLSDFSYDYNY